MNNPTTGRTSAPSAFVRPSRVLVTGGAGFIGSHLVDALVGQGREVLVIDDLSTGLRENVNARARLVVGSITDTRVVREAIAAVDVCVHLAAIASVERCNQAWAMSHGVNQSAFVALLECAARRPGGPVPVVYASSAAVYGDPRDLPIREASPTRPLSVYGTDKLGCELHARVAGMTAGLATFGLRFFNVYGVGQRPTSPYAGVISRFAEQIVRGEPVTIHGDGSHSRDFVHVSDAVRSILAALACASSDAPVCNIGTGVETPIVNLAEILGRIAARPLDVVRLPARTGDIARSVADMTTARQILGFEARVDLAAGLKSLIPGR